ncbi:hypothetical protein TNCV_2651151 [Trichonephila clavipes]|nr:hypothetical protein TNCV_2651151 [Trichonephila clavipes]
MEWNWACMTEMGNSFCAASSLCPISSKERGGEPVPLQPMTKCFQRETNLQTVNARITLKYSVHRGRSEHDGQCGVSHYLVRRWRLAGLEDRAQP